MNRIAQYVIPGFLLVILMTGGCSPAPPAMPEIDPFPVVLEIADQHAANGARTEAEAAYFDAAALRPDSVTPYLRLATLYRGWRRPDEGSAMLALAEARGASSPTTLPLNAAFYAMKEDWEAVLALDPVPTDRATRHRVAWAHVALGHVPEAIACYEVLLSADPTDQRAHERLGALLAVVEPTEAEPHLDAAGSALTVDLSTALVEQADEDAAYRLARVGRTLISHEEWHLAVLALERAVAQNPDYADANALLGHTLDQLDQSAEARGYLETAVQQAPESYLARSLLGLHHLQAGEVGSARQHLEAAYELDPENPAIALYLGYLYADLGYVDAANIWFEEAIFLAPNDASVTTAVVRFYISRSFGEEERVLEIANLLVEQAPESAASHDLLGWSQFLFGHMSEAKESLRHAISLDPELAAARYHLGQLAAATGDFRTAEAALVRANDLNTDPTLRDEIEQAIEDLP